MDFNNIFNRVRKIKTNNSNSNTVSSNAAQSQASSSYSSSSSSSPGKGLKKIATSRKITTQPTGSNKKAVCQTNSTDSNTSTSSTSTTGSSMCNTSCSSEAPSSRCQPLKSAALEQLRAKQEQRNTIDSGVESSHKKASPQNSNSSQGSVLSGHVDMASELQRRCQAAAKMAFKEENKAYKEKQEKAKQQQQKKTDESQEIRRAAIDLDSLTKKQAMQYAKKKKKKKKHRLKSDQSHTRIKLDKIMKRTSSSNCEVHSEDCCVAGAADETAGYPHYEETVHAVVPMPKKKQPVTNQVSNNTSSSGAHTNSSDAEDCEDESTEYTEDDCDFADDENENQAHKRKNKEQESAAGAQGVKTSSSEVDSAQGTYTGGDNSSETSEEKVKAQSKQKDRRASESARRASNSKTTIIEVKQPKPAVKVKPIESKMKMATNFPSQAATNKVQPTSRRVNGVTLRDLYSLRAVLSDSDNGTVFSGRRRIDNAAVAIKRIMKSKVKRWHIIKEKSVPMEIALLRRVNEQRHPGVVTLLEWFECSDCFLLVMARPTPVLDLFDFVSEKKRLDERVSRIIFVQVVHAMHHCHGRQVLHRDIKLENVLVKTDTLTTTVIDFGCGTILEDNLYKDFAGTPQYYPPEYYICKQYHGLPAAVWSIGVMLYAMLCGRLPFASAHEIVHLEPSWHGSFCRKISPAAKDLVEAMLKKQPRRRLNMSDVLKHKWLKGIKWNAQTGEVTFIVDEETNADVATIKNLSKSQTNVNASSTTANDHTSSHHHQTTAYYQASNV